MDLVVAPTIQRIWPSEAKPENQEHQDSKQLCIRCSTAMSKSVLNGFQFFEDGFRVIVIVELARECWSSYVACSASFPNVAFF